MQSFPVTRPSHSRDNQDEPEIAHHAFYMLVSNAGFWDQCQPGSKKELTVFLWNVNTSVSMWQPLNSFKLSFISMSRLYLTWLRFSFQFLLGNIGRSWHVFIEMGHGNLAPQDTVHFQMHGDTGMHVAPVHGMPRTLLLEIMRHGSEAWGYRSSGFHGEMA